MTRRERAAVVVAVLAIVTGVAILTFGQHFWGGWSAW